MLFRLHGSNAACCYASPAIHHFGKVVGRPAGVVTCCLVVLLARLVPQASLTAARPTNAARLQDFAQPRSVSPVARSASPVARTTQEFNVDLSKVDMGNMPWVSGLAMHVDVLGV